jgi:hypothetical protein
MEVFVIEFLFPLHQYVDCQQSASVFLYFRSSYAVSVPPSDLPGLLVRTDRGDARRESLASKEFVQGSVYPLPRTSLPEVILTPPVRSFNFVTSFI